MLELLLLFLGVAFAALGGVELVHSQTVFQQIASLVMFVVAAVLLSGAGILSAVNFARRRIIRELQGIAALIHAQNARPGRDQIVSQLERMT